MRWTLLYLRLHCSVTHSVTRWQHVTIYAAAVQFGIVDSRAAHHRRHPTKSRPCFHQDRPALGCSTHISQDHERPYSWRWWEDLSGHHIPTSIVYNSQPHTIARRTVGLTIVHVRRAGHRHWPIHRLRRRQLSLDNQNVDPDLLSLLDMHGLRQFVTTATRRPPTGSSLLDVVIANCTTCQLQQVTVSMTDDWRSIRPWPGHVAVFCQKSPITSNPYTPLPQR